MDPQRLADLVQQLEHDRSNGTQVGARLCETCVEILDVTGAGIMLMSEGEHRGTFGVSNDVISVVEDLQFTLGEGPCIDAFTSDQPVCEPDLRNPAAVRWPAFSGPAVEAGVRAVFGFPLESGTTRLGALDLYLDEPGELRPDQMSDAVALAKVISDTVLALQADASPGALAPELDASLHNRAVVHQASGMLSSRLNIGVRDALSRIRAYAYSVSRPINDVARDIVLRRLTLD